MCGPKSYHSTADVSAGTAIEHTAVLQMRGRTFGPPLIKRIYMPIPISGADSAEKREMSRLGPKQLVHELKPGEKVDSYFSVTYKKPVADYRYGSMFEFRAADKSGQATVKFWGGDDKATVQCIHDSFASGDVVHVRGEASEYKGAIEVSVSQKNGGTISKLDKGEYDIAQLIGSVEGVDQLKVRVSELVQSVEEPNMRHLLDAFFGDPEFMDAFCESPASIQLHSAAFGGLLHHTVNVADLCTWIVQLHPELDRDLVITGALLHDIGKVRSFKVTTNINQTPDGALIGHIAIGDEELLARIAALDGFPEGLAQKLRHILLAHHGKKEWGSPVDPMMPEALAVHMADDVDAKLDYMIAKRRDAVTEDDWIWDGRLGRLIYLK